MAERGVIRVHEIWTPAYIAIGSNLNDPALRVTQAMQRIAQLPQVQLELRSLLYVTKPLGPQDQPDYVNAAVAVVTTLSARELLNALLKLELKMGRSRQQRWGPRLIDLDLIWYVGPRVDEPGLSLPHPEVSARNFVLYPLADIAPELQIPGLGRVLDLKIRAGSSGISVLEL